MSHKPHGNIGGTHAVRNLDFSQMLSYSAFNGRNGRGNDDFVCFRKDVLPFLNYTSKIEAWMILVFSGLQQGKS